MDVGATGATRRVPDFRLWQRDVPHVPANESSVSPLNRRLERDLRRTPPGRVFGPCSVQGHPGHPG